MLGYVSHPYIKVYLYSFRQFVWTYRNSWLLWTLNPVMEPVKKKAKFLAFNIWNIINLKIYLRIFSGDKSNQHDNGRLIPIKPGAVK